MPHSQAVQLHLGEAHGGRHGGQRGGREVNGGLYHVGAEQRVLDQRLVQRRVVGFLDSGVRRNDGSGRGCVVLDDLLVGRHEQGAGAAGRIDHV